MHAYICVHMYVSLYVQCMLYNMSCNWCSQNLKELKSAEEEEESQEDIGTYVRKLSLTSLLLCLLCV